MPAATQKRAEWAYVHGNFHFVSIFGLAPPNPCPAKANARRVDHGGRPSVRHLAGRHRHLYFVGEPGITGESAAPRLEKLPCNFLIESRNGTASTLVLETMSLIAASPPGVRSVPK